jgi:hypothetical protein
MLFNLAAGPGGLGAYCEHFQDSYNRWWDDLGQIHFTPEIIKMLVSGVNEEAQGQSQEQLAKRRDDLVVATLKASGPSALRSTACHERFCQSIPRVSGHRNSCQEPPLSA